MNPLRLRFLDDPKQVTLPREDLFFYEQRVWREDLKRWMTSSCASHAISKGDPFLPGMWHHLGKPKWLDDGPRTRLRDP